MGILKTISKPISRVYKDFKRRINRPNMPCDFNEGISKNDLQIFAVNAVKTVKGKKIEITVKEAVVKGIVQSNSGLSTWMFRVDFNDYGHITGRYWLWSENDDSPVPKVVANRIRDSI